jgi:hypothetical protein
MFGVIKVKVVPNAHDALNDTPIPGPTPALITLVSHVQCSGTVVTDSPSLSEVSNDSNEVPSADMLNGMKGISIQMCL